MAGKKDAKESEDAVPEGENGEAEGEGGGKKKPPMMIIIIAAVVLVLALGGGGAAFFLLKPKPEQPFAPKQKPRLKQKRQKLKN